MSSKSKTKTKTKSKSTNTKVSPEQEKLLSVIDKCSLIDPIVLKIKKPMIEKLL